MALEEPLLFSAAIALSAMPHQPDYSQGCHENRPSSITVTAFDSSSRCTRKVPCLRTVWPLLLRVSFVHTRSSTVRFPELPNTRCKLTQWLEDVDPNRHLQGAYSLASREFLLGDPSATTLFTAGFWNYLREDITFSLFEGCPLKIDLCAVRPLSASSERNGLNDMSMVLGHIINATFGRTVTEDEWTSLMLATEQSYEMFPERQSPFSRAVQPVEALPLVWFLQDSHGMVHRTRNES